MKDMSGSVGDRRSKGIPVSKTLCWGINKEGILSIKTSHFTREKKTVHMCNTAAPKTVSAVMQDSYVI